MANNIDNGSDEERDDGAIAEEALKNPKTLLGKILANQGTPVAVAFLCFAGAAVYEKVEKTDNEKVGMSNVQEWSREVNLIRHTVNKAHIYESCVKGYQPSKECKESIGDEFDTQIENCANLTEKSDALSCCQQFSDRINHCMDSGGLKL